MYLISITYSTVSFMLYIVLSTATAEDNCTCAYYPEFEDIGPFCSQWKNRSTPFCLLSGKSGAEKCPGAAPWMNNSVYWTADEALCQKSSNYTDQHCHCEHYKDNDRIGPYCAKWRHSEAAWCILAGGAKGKFCPGAAQMWNGGLYRTGNKVVCSRNPQPLAKEISLSLRQPLSILEKVYISLLSLTFPIGTIGNLLVMWYFALENKVIRPGSRFVIVLAFIDFISSIWIPSIHIIEPLYKISGIRHWPFGEVTCRIRFLSSSMSYITSWLLLAISLERTRAVYKPFARKLETKFVILISVFIIASSFVIHYKIALMGEGFMGEGCIPLYDFFDF